mgnify:CR=1
MFERFQFENFAPTGELESFANLALYNVLDLAPQDSTATAIVERIGQYYACRIEVASSNGPFVVSVTAFEPKLAVQRGVEKLRDKIGIWQKLRLGFMNFLPPKTVDGADVHGAIVRSLEKSRPPTSIDI